MTADHQIYRNQCLVVVKLLKESNMPYYSNKVNACGRDAKVIYWTIKYIQGDSGAPSLPKGGMPNE